MKRKKKKKKVGFTLIELLAVILILGIIALIAIPSVSKVIEQSKKGAAETTTRNYVKSVNNKVLTSKIDSDRTNDLEDGTYDVSEIEVEMTGKLPTFGTITISNGVVTEVSVEVGDYIVTSTDGEKFTAVKADKVDNTVYVYFNDYLKENITSPSEGLTDRPDTNAYLKYPVVNDKLGYPIACVYYKNKEHCFTGKNIEKEKNEIFELFEYSTKPNSCDLSDYSIRCSNDEISVNLYKSGSNVGVVDYSSSLYCEVIGKYGSCNEGGY